MASKKSVVPVEAIESQIYVIRRHKVMLDADLAALYEVEVKALNQAVKRNIVRFPTDFMFQLTTEEAACLRVRAKISSQNSCPAFCQIGSI